VLLASFLIANACATVFSCVIDSLFVCCVRDIDEYKCTWMSDRLKLAFGFDKKAKKKRATKLKGEAAGGGEEQEAAPIKAEPTP
jgi:hypothetical protein